MGSVEHGEFQVIKLIRLVQFIMGITKLPFYITCYICNMQRCILRTCRFPFVRRIYYEGTNTALLKLKPHMKSLNDLIQQGSGIADRELEEARGLTKPDHTAILTYSSVSRQKLYIYIQTLHTSRELSAKLNFSYLAVSGKFNKFKFR